MAILLPRMAERIRRRLRRIGDPQTPIRIEMLRCPFYRGQGAYLVARIAAGQHIVPLVVALLQADRGAVVDALLLDTVAVSILFSYTRSAFHVPVARPRELVAFLQSIMPTKPEAEIYSAIGYHKHGKTVLYEDLCRHTAECTR